MEELPPLSERELEILRLVATGATNHEIARKLFISTNTVKVHLRNIFGKLEVASRTEATMVAVRRGWVEVAQPSGLATPEPKPGVALSESLPAPTPALPSLERWPRVHWSKRVILVAASALVLAAVLLPQILQGRSSGKAVSAISGVFPTPTAAADSRAGRWHTRAQMPTPRNGLAVVAYDGLVYAFGGVSNDGVTGKVEVYDPEADAWAGRSPKPTPVGFVSAAVVGGKVFIPGGIDLEQRIQDVLEVYDPGQDTWQNGAPLPEPLAAYAWAALDDQLYLFGGYNEQGYVKSAYHYDPAADRWEALKPMNEARGLLAAAALGNRIYVVGGYNDATEFNTCEAYDPAADAWQSCQPMALRRGGLALIAVRNNLYAIGGGMDSYLAFNERYDPRADAWSRIETPVTAQWRGLGAAFVDPYLYAIGGWNGGNLSANEAYQALFYQMIILP